MKNKRTAKAVGLMLIYTIVLGCAFALLDFAVFRFDGRPWLPLLGLFALGSAGVLAWWRRGAVGLRPPHGVVD